MYLCQWNSDSPSSAFSSWITNHFVKKIPPLRPVVLLIDGHGSHIDYYVSQFCAENQILLFRFPPHTSHAVQPTDRVFFGAFKHNFSKELAKFTVQYPGVSITKRQFPFIFTRAYELSCKMETVKSSFRATGIWPTDRMNVDHNLFNPSKAYQSLEAADISEIDVVSFNVESENDVNNRLLHSTNLKATDCPSVSTDNQVETDNNERNLLHKISSQQGELSVTCGPSTQQLFPPKQFIVESVPSINSEQSSPRNVLPDSIPQMMEKSFVSLPGGNASIGENIPSASTPKPLGQHPVQKALKDLENSIGNKKHIFLNRFMEGYDAPGDSLFIAWKGLYTDWKQIQESINTSTYSNKSAEDIQPIIDSVLTYPTIQRKAKSNKSKAQQLPKHMKTAEALSILQQKEVEKRRKEVIKEAKRQKKFSKTTSKNIKKSTKTTKEVPAPSNIPQRKSSGPRKKSRVVLENDDLSTEEELIEEESTEELYTSSSSDDSNKSSDEDEENNICTECKETYEEGQFWIKCDVCFKWFHVHCTDQRKRSVSSVKKLKAWKCKQCN